MNPLDALLRPMGDEEELRALAEALRGRQVAADFFAGSTVSPIQKMAQNEQQFIADAASRQGVLRNALEQRRLSQRQHEEDIAFRAKEYEENRALRRALLQMGGNFDPSAPGITKNVARYVDDQGNEYTVGFRSGVPVNLSTQQPMTAEEMQVLRRQDPLSEAAEVQAFEDLGGRTKELNNLVSQIESLDERLEPYAAEGVPLGEVPGFGFFEKMPLVGGAVRLGQDVLSSEAEAGKNFAAMKSVINTISRLRAGLAQTNTELSNIKAETGMDALSDPKVFGSYYNRLKGALEADLALISATTSPRVLKEYGKRSQSGRALFEHQFRRFEFPEGEATGERIRRFIPFLDEDEEETADGWAIEPED